MLTATLIAFIIKFLTGGHKSPFITPKLASRVKKSIKDDKKKKEILGVIDKTNKLQSRFDDRTKSYKKMLAALASEKDIEAQEYKDLFKGLLTDHKQLLNKIIDARLNMLKVLSEKEFELCIDSDYKPKEKSFNKAKKGLITHLTKMEKSVIKAIDDKTAQKDIVKAIGDFKTSSGDLIDAMAHMDIKDHEILGKYSANKDELKVVSETVNKLRTDFYLSFIALHKNLAKATTEKQWKAASKALKELIK